MSKTEGHRYIEYWVDGGEIVRVKKKLREYEKQLQDLDEQSKNISNLVYKNHKKLTPKSSN